MPDLAQQLADLPEETRRRLHEYGFDPDWFLAQAERLRSPHDNLVRGEIEPPAPEDVVDLPPRDSDEYRRLLERGEAALAAGEAALVVLAGGMATRMGGVVKALVEAVEGRTFLDLRLAAHRRLEEKVGRRIPLWLMTSQATEAPVVEALRDDLDGYYIATFPQMLSLRLDPAGGLYFDETGAPSEHAPGHGDLPDALERSGLLDRFIENGGRYITTANLDNLGATLDPALLAIHMESDAAVTAEVVDKEGSDKGGIPARLDGRPLILEEFRIPDWFDPSQVRVFNTNTFHFDAQALADLDMDWTYFIVEKKVDGGTAIQFERLINEVASHLDMRFVRVPRNGPESRFLPIKSSEDLEEKRQALAAIARDREMLD